MRRAGDVHWARRLWNAVLRERHLPGIGMPRRRAERYGNGRRLRGAELRPLRAGPCVRGLYGLREPNLNREGLCRADVQRPGPEWHRVGRRLRRRLRRLL